MKDADRRRARLIASLSPAGLRLRGLARFHTEIGLATDEQLDSWWGDGHELPARRAICRNRCRGMLRVLDLEFVGHDVWGALRLRGMSPWVARVRLGSDGRVVDREFISGQADYSRADRTGARGVFVHFALRDGAVYEVHDRARPLGPRRALVFHDGTSWHDVDPMEAARAQG